MEKDIGKKFICMSCGHIIYDENGNAKPAPKNAIYNERGEAIGTRSESSDSESSSSVPSSSPEPTYVAPGFTDVMMRILNEG